jgi:hypothetical protein
MCHVKAEGVGLYVHGEGVRHNNAQRRHKGPPYLFGAARTGGNTHLMRKVMH